MSNIIRWEPAREMMTLREAMDHLFDEAFTHPFGTRPNGSNRPSAIPAIDMYQTDDDVVVKAALPGIQPDDVQINVNGDVLSIKGNVKQEEESEGKAWHIREQRWGTFERQILLPNNVIADKAQAEFENGVLTVTLPKADEVRPKTINIKTN
jgi:HSP20 family protein